MSFDLFCLLFVLAVCAHNLEEALWLPAWSQRAGRWHVPVGRFEFGWAVAVLSLLAALAAWAALAPQTQGWGRLVVCGYAGAMLLNVFVPHLAGTLATGRYVPGTASAVLAVLPATAGLLDAARRTFRFDLATLAASTAVAALVLLAAIPGLFWAGRRLGQHLGPLERPTLRTARAADAAARASVRNVR